MKGLILCHGKIQTGGQTTLRKCFRRQAEKMAAVIRDDAAYLPFALQG
jgi:hypothetical protein